MSNQLPFEKTEFRQETLSESLNNIIYGINCLYGPSRKEAILFINESDEEQLMIFYHKESLPSKLESINLRETIDLRIKAIEGKDDFLKPNTLYLETSKKKHLIEFKSEKDRSYFQQGIQHLIEDAMRYRYENMRQDSAGQLALDLFLKADSDLSNALSYEEAYTIMRKANVQLSKRELTNIFNQYDKDNNKQLSQDEFIKIARELSQKRELKEVFQKYVNGFNDSVNLNFRMMTKAQFMKFINEEQHQDTLDPSDTSKIDHFFSERHGEISYNDFINLIFNYSNSIFDPQKLSNTQDMSLPLTDYYINSSHNTYLMANQLTGDSSVQAYINVFRRGCRCVEIDSWDGNNEPIVTHGFTLTTSIKFKDIISVIKDYGFQWSKYPIILSIENHCGKENQKKMASLLQEILGPMLYLIPGNYDQMRFYPSPQELLKKVIVKSKGSFAKIIQDLQIKGKKNNHQRVKSAFIFPLLSEEELCSKQENAPSDQINLNTVYLLERCRSHCDSNEMEFNDQNQLLRIPTMKNANNQHYKNFFHNSNKSIKENQNIQDTKITQENLEDDDEEEYTYQVLEVKDFQKCISMVGVSFNKQSIESFSPENNENKQKIFDIFSLCEIKILRLLKTHEEQLVSFHRYHFSRIYPKGSRVDSSNYDPMPSFISGSQIIALNFQTFDFPLFLYLSKFQQNGGNNSGYVLKPNFLRHKHNKLLSNSDHSKCFSNSHKPQPLPSHFTSPKFKLSISIISGQCIKSDNEENSSFNPFFEISIKGTSADQSIIRTNAAQNNAFHPIFSPNKAQFTISCPEIAMVVFQIFNKGFLSNDLVAQYALDFTCMRSGYRIIPLWDKQLNPIVYAMVLAKIEIEPLIGDKQES